MRRYNRVGDEYVGMNFNIDNPHANIVVYDSLELKMLKESTISPEKIRERHTHRIKKKDTIQAKGVYFFDDQVFLPLEKRGLKEDKTTEFGANYGFTMELHTKILYRGGEYFKFRGENDLWLFINGKLEIDLGGVHVPLSGEVRLDDIPGLKRGRLYDVDIFFASRSLDGSSLRIEGTFIPEIPGGRPVDIAINRKTFIPGEEEVKIQIIARKRNQALWKILVRDDDSNTIRSFSGTDTMPLQIFWDGKDKNNNTVEWNKEFNVVGMGIDKKGNDWKSNIETIKTMIEFEKGDKMIVRSVYFTPFSYEIERAATLVLDRISDLLKQKDEKKLLIIGHVSFHSEWTEEQLYTLSLQRAQEVKKYLVKKGISRDRIDAIGKGSKEPFIDRTGQRDDEKSRRTEFEIK